MINYLCFIYYISAESNNVLFIDNINILICFNIYSFYFFFLSFREPINVKIHSVSFLKL